MHVKDASWYSAKRVHNTSIHLSAVIQASNRRPSGRKGNILMIWGHWNVSHIWSTQKQRPPCWWDVGTTHQCYEKTPRWVKVWDVIQGTRQLEVPAMLSWTLGFWDGSYTAVPSAHTSFHLRAISSASGREGIPLRLPMAVRREGIGC